MIAEQSSYASRKSPTIEKASLTGAFSFYAILRIMNAGKQKFPKSQSRKVVSKTSSPKSHNKTSWGPIPPGVGSYRKGKQNPKITGLVVVIAVAAIVFWVYAWLGYGGVKGFVLAHKSFPGQNSPALTQPREKFQKQDALANDKLANLPNAGRITSVLKQQQDKCVRGEHSFPIAGATEDSYAYWCTLSTESIFGATAPVCDVINALVQADISLYANQIDCTTQVPSLQVGDGNNYFDGHDKSLQQVTVYTQQTFAAERGTITFIRSCDDGRPVVFCKNIDSDDATIAAKLNAITPDTQTILMYQSNDTYYQK